MPNRAVAYYAMHAAPNKHRRVVVINFPNGATLRYNSYGIDYEIDTHKRNSDVWNQLFDDPALYLWALAEKFGYPNEVMILPYTD